MDEQPKKTLIFTILYNRPDMLKLSAANVLAHAKNCRYVLWDNGDDRRVTEFCEKLVKENQDPSIEIIYHRSENIGLNAARKIVDTYLDDAEFIMGVDEDILFLPLGFQSILQQILSQEERKIGYMACNVFQDGNTNGARPGLDQYRRENIGGRRVLFGPTGGWASMTKTHLYKEVGGFPEHEEKFFGLDGVYSSKLHQIGIETGIAEDVVCYHATGPIWNSYFNYQKIYLDKWTQYTKSKT